jgi:hypothetical protein
MSEADVPVRTCFLAERNLFIVSDLLSHSNCPAKSDALT